MSLIEKGHCLRWCGQYFKRFGAPSDTRSLHSFFAALKGPAPVWRPFIIQIILLWVLSLHYISFSFVLQNHPVSSLGSITLPYFGLLLPTSIFHLSFLPPLHRFTLFRWVHILIYFYSSLPTLHFFLPTSTLPSDGLLQSYHAFQFPTHLSSYSIFKPHLSVSCHPYFRHSFLTLSCRFPPSLYLRHSPLPLLSPSALRACLPVRVGNFGWLLWWLAALPEIEF